MASKTSMLKQGAKTTGKGLFAGMSRLDAREEAQSENNEITDVVENDTEKTASVNENDKELVEKTIEHPAQELVKQEAQNPIEIQTAEPEKEYILENKKEPVIETVTEQIALSDNKLEEEPVKEPVDEMKSVADQTAIQADTQLADVEPKKNTNEKTEVPSTKSSSRYEKDKFLLLDIRGYRDYVEHMAKAATMSAPKYIRNLIQQDMDKNNDIYLAHKALEEKLRGRSGN